MLEQNRLWLEQSNPALLKQYTEGPQTEPRDPMAPHCLQMAHEGKNPNLPDSYISPVAYQEQQTISLEIKEKDFQGELRFCIVGGTDGGHLLNETVARHQIKHLVVIESDLASFNRSLSVTDWPALFRDFDEKGGTIYFHIGPVTLEVKERISQHLKDIGTFNASNIFMVHDDSHEGKKGIANAVQCLQDVINSLGFYDDERVGLAHTAHKMKEGARFMHNMILPWIDKPAVVCGNGPSLLKLLPQIKRHRKHLYLISCGTAIGVLYEKGIKPDFHIEQERPKVTSNWTKLRTTPEFRDGITCIGLNVVHPQTHGLFKDIAYCLKSNDFGGVLAEQHAPDMPRLMFVNPLVANCGSAVACALGFKHVYLAGVDCSFAKDGASHSGKSSMVTKGIDRMEIEGNFRDKVETTTLYNESKKALEYLIKSNPRTIFYNLCDGARINGARPTKKFKPRTSRPISKTQIMAPFKPIENPLDVDAMTRSFTASMFGLKTVVDNIPEEVKGKDEAYFFIQGVHNHLRQLKEKTPLFWYLVKGTISTQLVFLAGCADRDLEAFGRSANILKELVAKIHQEIKVDLLKFDDWERNGELPEDVNRSCE